MDINQEKVDWRELAFKASSGDRGALSELYELLYAPIFRFIRLQVKDERDAEDLAQDVFFKVIRSISDYKDLGFSIKTWVYKIAQNSLIDYWKKRKDQIHEDAWFDLKDGSRTPEEEVILARRRDYLYEVLNQLLPEHKQIILLGFVEDLSHSEIAVILGKSEEAVRALRSRAIKSLRKLVDFNKI